MFSKRTTTVPSVVARTLIVLKQAGGTQLRKGLLRPTAHRWLMPPIALCSVPYTIWCQHRSHTPPPGASGQGPANYAPANIWGSAMAAHQAATAGGGHTPNPSPSTSSYQSPAPPPPQSYPPPQQHPHQQQQQQQQDTDPSAAVISVSHAPFCRSPLALNCCFECQVNLMLQPQLADVW